MKPKKGYAKMDDRKVKVETTQETVANTGKERVPMPQRPAMAPGNKRVAPKRKV